MTTLRFCTINIEGNKHWDTVLPYIDRQDPDVLCIQEIFEKDLQLLKTRGYETLFLEMTYKQCGNKMTPHGIALCSKCTVATHENIYYHQHKNASLPFDTNAKRMTQSHGVIFASLVKENTTINIATTHFTWCPDGLDTPLQEKDLLALLAILRQKDPHILCGDFNIPRHINRLYNMLCEEYTDEIPKVYTSSLDKDTHYRGGSKDYEHLFTSYMVDYIFSQTGYTVEDASLTFGISDHAAISATIKK